MTFKNSSGYLSYSLEIRKKKNHSIDTNDQNENFQFLGTYFREESTNSSEMQHSNIKTIEEEFQKEEDSLCENSTRCSITKIINCNNK